MMTGTSGRFPSPDSGVSPFQTLAPAKTPTTASASTSGRPSPSEPGGEQPQKPTSLKGVFKTFPLQDLLLLVSQQRRTGVLHLTEGEDGAIDMTFREGMLIKAKKARPKARELFGNLLVEARLITDAQRALAVDEQRRTLKQLGEILVDMGALSREALREFVHLQTMEAIYQPFEWGPDGAWEFTEISLGDDFEGVLPMDCASIVKEGLRRRTIWPALRRRFKTQQVTFRRVKPFPPPGSPALVKAQKKGNILGARERRIYSLAEPGVSLANIVALSKVGEFESLCALDDLYDAGLIRLGPLQGMESSEARGGLLSNLRGKAGAIAFALATLALGAFSVWRGMGGTIGGAAVGAPIGAQEGELAIQEILGGAQTSRISLAIETYRIRTGKIPGSLQDLVDMGLLSQRDMSYPFKAKYVYRPQKDGSYLLLPPLQ